MAQLLSKMQLTAAPTADGSGVTVHVPITRSDVLHGQECMCMPAGGPVVAAGTSSSCLPLCMPGTMCGSSQGKAQHALGADSCVACTPQTSEIW